MSAVMPSLSREQETKLLSFFGHARLHLLYKASVHGFTAAAFHSRCDQQGPTVIVAFNAAGRIYGAYTSKDYAKSGQAVTDGEAFLYSITAEPKPLKVVGIGGQPAFTDVDSGPDYGALVFLHDDTAAVLSNPGTNYDFQASDMHGGNFTLTELEVYRVEGQRIVWGWGVLRFDVLLRCFYIPHADLGKLIRKPWRNIKWTGECVKKKASKLALI